MQAPAGGSNGRDGHRAPAGVEPVATGHGLRDFEEEEAGRVRYLCACGVVGAWVLSVAQARSGHWDHSLDAHAFTKSGGARGQA